VPNAELQLVKDMLPQLMGGVAQLKVPQLVELGVGKNWDEEH
jgi:DNA polymerase-1